MKTTILIAIALLFIACGSDPDKQAQLKELEQKRNDLNAQIEQLRAELAMQTDNDKEIKKVVEISQVTYTPFRHFVKIQGTVESDNNILVPAQASGVVKKIYVKEGQSVKKGQLLAELDGAIYESSIKELETNLEMATTLFKRQRRLWEKKIGSEIQFLQAKTSKESLEQKLETVKEQYRLTKITAPIDGSVDQIMIKENEATAAGMGTIRVVKLTDLKITAKLSEVYQGSIKKGDSVDVEIPLLNKTFKTRVSAVAKVIDPNNRTFIVEISVPKSINNLKPNILVRLSINDYTNPEALTVPLKSIQKTADATFLFVANIEKESAGNIYTAEKRFIQPGMYYENRLEVKDGLQNGEFVIITGFRDLANNEKVRLANADPKTSVN